MTKKSKSTPEESKRFSNKQLIAVSIIAVSIIVSASVLSYWLTKAPEARFPLKAIIIDQLGKEPEFLNASFINSATDVLKSSGFNVTYYNQTIDVNFYRSLAKSDYGIIILRAHTALRETNDTVDIFTSEEFVNGKYQSELENGLVTKGQFLYYQLLNKPEKFFFAITSKFVDNLDGRFPKSIVLAMGCWSLKLGLDDRMPKAFINKGAVAYIGWTDLVLAPDTDAETLKLLRLLLVENRTLSDAVSRTSSYKYTANDTTNNQLITFTTKLRSYPSEADSLKVSTLINEARAAMTFQNNPSVTMNFNGVERGPRKKSFAFSKTSVMSPF
jgi:hypothetical protein